MNMLKPEYPQSLQTEDSIAALIPSPADTFNSILDFMRRQYPVIVFAVAVSIALGLLYVLTTPPSFTASATMIIDTKKVQLFQQQSMFSDLPIDASTVESQVEILKSETIALAVIKKLHLDRRSRICRRRWRTHWHGAGRRDRDCFRPAASRRSEFM